jgi:hypothetical protein
MARKATPRLRAWSRAAVAAVLLALFAPHAGTAQSLGPYAHGQPRTADSFLTCFSRDFAVEMAVALNRHLQSGGDIDDLSGSKGGETAGEMMMEGRCFRARNIDHTPAETVYRDRDQPRHDRRLYSVVASHVRHQGKAVVVHIVTTENVPPPPKKNKTTFK